VETNVRTPLAVFNLPQHLVVPLFQRPYVWDEEHQWEPLWQDVRRMAELRLGNPGTTATHFLGAVVLQAQTNQTGTMQLRHIIDGQQRLTTLQLLIDCAEAVFDTVGLEPFARQMESLTHNATHFVPDGHSRLKLRHTNRDRSAYDEVMSADPPVAHDELVHTSSRPALAHKYFSGCLETWLSDDSDWPGDMKAEALTWVMTQALQLVVIDLRADENSQEIFETLNARGTPLTAADLIKNFVFQRLEAEGVDTHAAYAKDWPFEETFWEKELSVGRFLISRGSLFLNQWLGSRVGEEVSPRATFTRFKHFVEHQADMTMHDLLRVISTQAGLYRTWTQRAGDPHADLDRVELCVYRMQASDVELLKPLLIWLHELPGQYSTETIAAAVDMAESWVVRRAMLRLPSADLGRIVASLISQHRGVSDDELVPKVANYLGSLDAASTYWPGDEEIRRQLALEPVYQRFKRGRLRMLLEAMEDHLRGFTGTSSSKTGSRVPRVGYPIEHLMPRSWEQHWKVDGLETENRRREHIHRLGNLTLLTTALNSSMRNAPWHGPKGKRNSLQAHDVLLMNRRVLESSEHGWDEERIDDRTNVLIDALLATWTVPEGHKGKVKDTDLKSNATVTLAHLTRSGLLTAGTRLRARPAQFADRECVVTADGMLELDGKVFGAPSSAGHHLTQKGTNGWMFWCLADGRRLDELRTEYEAERRGTE
jgi:hypothetical protein